MEALPLYTVVVGLLLILLTVQRLRTPKKKWPPTAGNSWIENIKEMNGVNAPQYLLNIIKSTNEKVFRLRLPMLQPLIICAEGKAVRAILESKFSEKPAIFYGPFEAITCGFPTLFTLPTSAPAWHQARKGMAPAFSDRKINTALCSEECDQVLADLNAALDIYDQADHSIDLAQLMTATTMDLLGAIACGGMHFNTLKGEIATFQGTTKTNTSKGAYTLALLEPVLREFAGARLVNPYRKYYGFLLSASRLAIRNAKKIMALAHQVLDEYYAKNCNIHLDESILGRIANSDTYKSKSHRAADVVTLLVAGYDTTSYSLSFLLYELAARPQLVSLIQQELEASTEKKDQYSPLLSRCIKESMRLWPVAALGSGRTLSEPLNLQDGRIIPAGATCTCAFYPLFRAMDIPYVNEFRPERWLDQDQLPLLNSYVLPFSLGKRNCVGQALASAELRLIATSIIKNFSLELITPFSTSYFLTLKPVNGAVRIRRRQFSSSS